MSAKLYFRYGVMNSGKSLFLLSTAHNFSERGVPYLILKSTVDTRDICVKSRALSSKQSCVSVAPETDVYEYFKNLSDKNYQWILVDEAQFMQPAQIDQLAHIVDEFNINIICYGLRTDFQTKMFPGSLRLFEIADKFEEMKSTCHCGKKASVNARVDSSGHLITVGNQVECGSEDKYITLCRDCYNKAIMLGCSVDELKMN